jgi:SAM-dependent methyltransferase
VAGVTFDQAYFDALYSQNPDPWDFRSSAYEKQKYEATLAALPADRYNHVLELGCSIGELTHLLAVRARHVTGVDTSPVALQEARLRCADLGNVDFVQAHLPGGDWERPADLVVLSEILYYLEPPGIEHVASRIMHCAPDADMVLVHWTGETNYPLGGDEAVEHFLESVRPIETMTVRAPKYRLDIAKARFR